MGEETGTGRLCSRELANSAVQICSVSPQVLHRFIPFYPFLKISLYHKVPDQLPEVPTQICAMPFHFLKP